MITATYSKSCRITLARTLGHCDPNDRPRHVKTSYSFPSAEKTVAVTGALALQAFGRSLILGLVGQTLALRLLPLGPLARLLGLLLQRLTLLGRSPGLCNNRVTAAAAGPNL
jgi:hypothetical protein